MRINQYIAASSNISRRKADQLIKQDRVLVDGLKPVIGQQIKPDQRVTLDNKLLSLTTKTKLLMINKPVGYVVSKKGQGAPTIYSLLKPSYRRLKPIGRLDKDSSGLLLMSDNGQLIHQLSHPSFNKQKVYEVTLNRAIKQQDLELLRRGIMLDDGISKLKVIRSASKNITVALEEGRNRQVRRTFSALGYQVVGLNRVAFGQYKLNNLQPGQFIEVKY